MTIYDIGVKIIDTGMFVSHKIKIVFYFNVCNAVRKSLKMKGDASRLPPGLGLISNIMIVFVIMKSAHAKPEKLS